MTDTGTGIEPYSRADVYDDLYSARGKDYRTEAEEIGRTIRARNPRARTLLDVACGSGAHLAEFPRFFSGLHGVDLSAEMVELCRVRNPGITVTRADMRTLDLSRTFDAVTCLFGSVGYLETQDDLDRTIAALGRHLTPGGVLVVEPWWAPNRFLPGYVRGDSVDVGSRVIARVSSAHWHPHRSASRMQVQYTVARPGADIETFLEVHDLTLFTEEDYRGAFDAAGLAVERLDDDPATPGLYVGVAGSGRNGETP